MKKILLTAFFGYFAVLLVGMLFYRFQIFNPQFHYFQFVELGFIGAVIYPLFLYREKTEIISVISLLFIFHFIIFIPGETEILIRDMVMLGSLIISVYIYSVKLLPLIRQKYKILMVFSLAFLYGIVNTIGSVLIMVLIYLFFDRWYASYGELLLLYFRYGFMIGFGLAAGFNFAGFAVIKAGDRGTNKVLPRQ